MTETPAKPENLRDLMKLAADEDESVLRRAIAKKASNSRARLTRRRREIERMMYFGLSDHDILAEFLFQPDLEALLVGFEGERGAQTFQDEISAIRKARDKDGEVKTGQNDLIRMYRELGRLTIADYASIEGSQKRYWQESQITLHREIAKLTGVIEQPQGHSTRPKRPAPAAAPDAAADNHPWAEVMKGYKVKNEPEQHEPNDPE